MSEGECETSDSQEQCLFIRKEIESNNDEDDWDDTQLIREYDRAIEKAKRQVLRKIQSEMGLTNAEIQEVFSDTTKSKSYNFTKSKKDKAQKSKKNKPSWTIGSACRAIYSEDGEEYEAEIVQLVQHNKCTVKFIGYDNQEEVCLSDLTPSLGKHVIDLQIMAANLDPAASEDEMDAEEDTSSSKSRFRESNHKKVPTHNITNGQNSFEPRQMSSIQRPSMVPHIPPPPPPPLPPSMGHHSFKNHRIPVEDDEALNSMLMSWYMCGYYAGYYQRAMKN